jgi:hypothetical protein
VKKNSQRPAAGRDKSGPRDKLAAETDELLRQIQGRVETFDSASRIWHDHLSDSERSAVGGNLEIAWHQYCGTLGIVSHARKCSPAEALLWLTEEMGTLPAARIHLLRQEQGLPRKSSPRPVVSRVPVWNKDRGELSLNGKVIRKFRSTTVAKRAVSILDAFEASGWLERIDNPLASGDAHEMREAVHSLNKSLQVIRFESDGTSGGISWKRR